MARGTLTTVRTLHSAKVNEGRRIHGAHFPVFLTNPLIAVYPQFLTCSALLGFYFFFLFLWVRGGSGGWLRGAPSFIPIRQALQDVEPVFGRTR